VMFAIQNAAEWERFCERVVPSLTGDARFTTNALRLEHGAALAAIIEARLRTMTRVEALELLAAADIPTGTVNDAAAVAEHAQLQARRRWRQVASPGGEIPALIPPHNIAGVDPVMGRVPELGEHTREVLAKL
jgi:itaconate CoA-transferase